MNKGLRRCGLLLATVAVPVLLMGAGGDNEKGTKGGKVKPEALLEAATRYPAPYAVGQSVGTVEGTNAYIGIRYNDATKSVSLYVCDGADLYGWLEGPVKRNRFELSNDKGLAVEGTLADGGASGTVTLPDGSIHPFTTEAAELPAGLYEQYGSTDGNAVRAGTIVLPDGTQRGAAIPAPSPPPATLEQCRGVQKQFRAAAAISSTYPPGGLATGTDSALAEYYEGAIEGAGNANSFWSSRGCSRFSHGQNLFANPPLI